MSRGSIEIPLRDTDEVSEERGRAMNLDDPKRRFCSPRFFEGRAAVELLGPGTSLLVTFLDCRDFGKVRLQPAPC